jgi:kexin
MPLGSLLLHFLFGTLSGSRIASDGIDLVVFSPDLTWRDIQHLTVRTAEIINGDDPDWDRTSSGRLFSYKYGYGRLNGYDFVTAAQEWQLVKPQAWVELPAMRVGNGSSTLNGEMSGGLSIVPDGVTSTITITQEDLNQNNFEALEHITVRVWITHDRRGDVEVEVISPNGIKSILAARRRDDTNRDGYPAWRFMSVKHW